MPIALFYNKRKSIRSPCAVGCDWLRQYQFSLSIHTPISDVYYEYSIKSFIHQILYPLSHTTLSGTVMANIVISGNIVITRTNIFLPNHKFLDPLLHLMSKVYST
uniref:Uncharacterized protein n=1 Tax=Arundo donax TaxID=35708 RepID=A0A0A8Y9Y3_ARUDO